MVVNFNKLLENNKSSVSSENSFLKNLEQNHNVEFNKRNFSYPLEYDAKFTDKSIKATEPYLSSFVVSVDGKTEVNLQQIADSILVSKLPFKEQTFDNNQMKLRVTKVIARSGNFKPEFTITSEYGRTGSNSSRIACLDFFVDVTMGQEIAKARLQIFAKNGKITMQGGYLNQQLENIDNDVYFTAQPELIRNFIVDNYTDKRESFRADFKYDNVVGQFKVNRGFSLPLLYKKFSENPMYTAYYETQLSPLLTFQVKGDTTKFSLSTRGIVQLKNLKDESQLDKSYKNAIEIIQNMIDYDKAFPPPHMLKIDRNLAFFRVKKQRVTKSNLPAPNVGRRSTTCPFDRCPVPYSFQGKCAKQGYYVKPNPQGQPCCFRIPKRTTFSKNKVRAAYEKAGVRVPNNVRKIFNFGNNTNNKLNNTSHNYANIKITMNAVKGVKIGTRQAKRYSRVALVNIATRLGIPMSTKFQSKEALINLISKKAQNVTNNFTTFKVANKSYKLSGNSVSTLRVGDRLVGSYTKPMLIKFAQSLRIAVGNAFTSAQIVKAIYDEYRRRRPVSRSGSRSRSGSTSSVLSNREAFQMVLNQLKLDQKTLEQNIKNGYGEKWLKKWGKFLKPLKNQAEDLYSKLVTNLENEPTPNGIRQKKNQLIKNMKNQYERELRAQAFSNIKNVNVRNAVMKFASTRKSNGTFPTSSEIEKFKKSPPRKTVLNKRRFNVEEL